MPTSYPNALDAFTNPSDTDDLDTPGVLHDEQHANANDAIEAIQGELGAAPSGAYATVKARLDAVQSRVFDAVAYGALVDGSTNDTAAWQAAINAAAAAGGGIVTSSKSGVSIIAGALQDTSGANAQLLLPSKHCLADEQISITLAGPFTPPAVMSVIGATPTPDNHLVLKSTLAAGTGAVIGARGPSGSYQGFSLIHVGIFDIGIRMVSNPTNTAIDLSHVVSCELDGVVIDAGTYNVDAVIEPTTATSYGIRLPMNNNGARTRLGRTDVIGFYTGYQFAEHTNGLDVNAWGCKVAAEFNATNHASVFQRFMPVHCQRGFKFTGAHAVDVYQFDIEHVTVALTPSAPAWQETVYDLDDASNYGKGFIRWHAVLGNFGDQDSFAVNGGTGFTTSRVGDSLGAGGGAAELYVVRDSVAAIAGDTLLVLGAAPVAGSPIVWVDGGLMWPGADYSISGDSVTFDAAMTGGEVVRVWYQTADSAAGAASFEAAPVNIQDDFNRANGSLGTTSVGGATWVTPLGTWAVVSNQAAETAGAAQLNHCYVESAISDGTISVKLAALPGGAGGYMGLYVRQAGATDSGIVIQCAKAENTVEVIRRTAGSNTVVATTAYTWAAGDVMAVTLLGSSIVVKVNGVTKHSVTEATYAANTKHGLWNWPNSGAFDDFSIQS